MAIEHALFTHTERFRLEDIDGTVLPYPTASILIREPKKFKDIKLILKRDTKMHGFTFEYSSAEVKLQYSFNKHTDETKVDSYGDVWSMRSFLQSIYNANGTNGKVHFYYEHLIGEDWIIQYKGRVNFNKYRYRNKKLEIPVKRMKFDDKFRSRMDTKVGMKQQIDFDNVDQLIGSLPPTESIVTHSKTIRRRFLAEVDNSLSSQSGINFTADISHNKDTDHQTNVSCLLGLTQETRNEIDDYSQFGTVSQFLEIGETREPVIGDSAHYINGDAIYNIKEKGYYTFTHESDIDWHITTELGYTRNCYMKVWLIVVQPTGVTTFILQNTLVNSSGDFTVNTAHTVENSINLNKGDKVYLIGLVSLPHVSDIANGFDETIEYEITLNTNKLTVNADTVVPSSSVELAKLSDLMEHNILMTTGESGVLVSGELKSGGCFHDMYVSNGKFMRGLIYDSGDTDTYNNVPRYSWEDLFNNGCQTMFGLGMAIHDDVNGDSKVLIERYSHFYRSDTVNMIYQVAATEDWEMTIAEKEIYNEVIVGYNKFLEGDEDFASNSLDEFNTYQEYLTPLETVKNKLDLRTDFIASGFVIEATRRQQYEEDDQWKFDDDLFIISCNLVSFVKPTSVHYVNNGVSNMIFINRYCPDFSTAASIAFYRVCSGVPATTYFTVTGFVASQAENNTVIFVSTTVSDTDFDNCTSKIITFYTDVGHTTLLEVKRPETDNVFASVTGVFDPTSIYNGRLNPKYLFLNNSPIIASGLFYENVNGKYLNTFTKNNGKFEARLNSGETCSSLDPNRINWRMDGDVPFVDTDYPNTLYRHERAKFTFYADYDDIDIIKKSLLNENFADDDKNRGHLFVPDDEGIWWIVFPDEIEYNPMSKKVKCKGKVQTAGDFNLDGALIDVRILEDGSQYRLIESGGYRKMQ